MSQQNRESQQPDRRIQHALMANLRHDLRTPINAILGYSEMLLEELEENQPSDPDVLADLQKIHTSGEQLLRLVNTILDPNKLESRQEEIDFAEFGETIRVELRTPLNTAIGYSEILLEDATEETAPDLERIRLAAQKLVSTIGDIVNLSQQQLQDASDEALATVNFALEDRGKAALVEQVVNTMRELDQERQHETTHHTGHILVVDDNETNRDLLSRQLERQGYNATAVADGQKAIQALKDGNYDLVLLDVIMPGMNGYQVLSQLKTDRDWRNIPVIMISALDEIDSVIHCIEIGAEDYLNKPFNPTLLRARLEACLEKKRLRDQELEYLRQVAKVTDAACQVEAGDFEPQLLAEVADRSDALGQLARMFQNMAKEVFAREQRLKQQVQKLRIEIDQTKRERQVSEITGTDYFKSLKQKARGLRSQLEKPDS